MAAGAGSRLGHRPKCLLQLDGVPLILRQISALKAAGVDDLVVVETSDAVLVAHKDKAQDVKNIVDQLKADNPSVLVLGNNIFYSHDLVKQLNSADIRTSGASVFAYHVHDPERYGVVEFNEQFRSLSIEEKPAKPESNFAVTGLYFYDEQVCDIAAAVKPSQRGKLEIIDVNRRYLELNQLNVEIMGRGYAWLDTGTHDSLLEAASFIGTLQKRQGLMVACPEEIAFHQKWIDAIALERLAKPLAKNGYGQYLLNLLNN
jgi:glucose-1-phosphate thymidylyltransferase